MRKCPYCDFNSHQAPGDLNEGAYVAALLDDLKHDLPLVAGRQVQSVFIGGGTPSLLSAGALHALLDGVRGSLSLNADAEITMEANPGAVDVSHFSGYREAGVNRLSLGAQSFDDQMLGKIGRIHQSDDIVQAFHAARGAGFDNINLDLMFGLPLQRQQDALADLQAALDLNPQHLSWYQMTLEPNTWFHHHPPLVADDDEIAAMQRAGQELLAKAGYAQYEVSAYAKAGAQCQHNLNYWCFGDYIGIGAGAHGKLSLPEGQVRTVRERHPKTFLTQAASGQARKLQSLNQQDLRAEFMLNTLRLNDGVPLALFVERTGLPPDDLAQGLESARAKGLLERDLEWIRPTELGRWFLNDLITEFL